MKNLLMAALLSLAVSARAQTYNSQVNNLTANGSITANSSSVTANAFFGNGAGITGISTAVDTNTLSGIVPVSKGGTQSGTLTANSFLFGNGTGAVQAFSSMTVTGAGNVGIGTSNPTAMFQVGNGTIAALANGNVGIGTTNPTSLLTIGAGSICPATDGQVSLGGSGCSNRMSNATFVYDVTFAGGLDSSAVSGYNNGILPINPTGSNVGIGLYSPVYGLHVANANGVALSTTSTLGYGLLVDTTGQIRVGTSAGTQLYRCSGGTAANLIMYGATGAEQTICTGGGGSLVTVPLFIP